MTISSASRYFLWTGLFLIFGAGVGSVVVRAEEVPLPVDVDVCANVPGEQDTEPCADVQCLTDGGTWNGDSCDLLPPPPPAEEPLPDELNNTIATSTDGTGGLMGGEIVTGDATASTTVDNELNTNIINVADTCSEDSNDELCDAPGEEMNSSNLTASTTTTGDAFATSNVINLVNTNIFNSYGLILFLNQLFGGGFDLRDFNLSYFFDGEAGASHTVHEGTGQPQITLRNP